MAAIQAIDAISTGNTSATAQVLAQKVAGGGKSGGGGGGGAGKAQSASGSSSSSETSTTYDKMDLNKDGTVSASEKALYLMMHPDEAEDTTSNSNYNNQGTQDEYEGGFSGILNLSA
jgi:hypothetical protein